MILPVHTHAFFDVVVFVVEVVDAVVVVLYEKLLPFHVAASALSFP